MGLYRYEPIEISYHPAKFDGQKHCVSGCIMILVNPVILQDHVIKGSCDFLGRGLSREITILPSLVAIGTMVAEIY